MEGVTLALITGQDPLSPGGHESYVRAHALAACRLGLKPHLFCASDRAGVQETAFGVIHRVPAPPRRPPPALAQVPLPVRLAFLARGAARSLSRAPGPRLIHGFGIYAAAGAAASLLLERRGQPTVPVASAYATRAYEIAIMQDGLKAYHGPGHRLRYHAWLHWVRKFDDAVERWGYTNSRLVLVNYASVERLLLRSYGAAPNLHRIPYCSPAAFEPENSAPDEVVAAPRPELAGLEPADAPLVVSVSRHDPRKGVDLLLRALAQLKQAEVPFRACLVGPGRLLETHRRLCAGLGLEGQVSLPGAVADPGRYLAGADVFVLPSLAEASGSLSVLEALQAQTAVLATSCDGIPEDLTDGQDAVLVAPGDVAELARELGRLLSDPGLRRRIAAGGYRTYERRFSAERFTAALSEVYAELAPEASGSAATARIVSAT